MKAPKRMFTIAQAADLAPAPVATVRDWFADKPRRAALFELDDSRDQTASQGGTRYLSIHTTLAVCIAAEFNRIGIPIERAAKAGWAFAFSLNGSPKRKNGQPLYGGKSKTLIALNANDDVEIFALGPDSHWGDVLLRIGDGAAVIVADPIVERIEKAATA